MILDALFDDEPDMAAYSRTEPVEQKPSKEGSSQEQQLPPPPLHVSHPAMFQALNAAEITTLIRQELRGVELKPMVLVSRQWWKAFGPYLWENVYIDADPEQDDRHVIFRNGLAVKSLTLSIYDPLDARGVVSYVAERCRNVTNLHLKLFSSELVVISDISSQERSNRDSDVSKDTKRFMLREETRTTLLDSLLASLPYVQELTLSIAHEDLRPEVVWCASTLPRLRKMTLYGGLRAMNYVLRKNRRCDWTLLMRIARDCPSLEMLSVGWESPDLQKDEKELMRMADMFQVLENYPSDPSYQDAGCASGAIGDPIPAIEKVPSLKWLNVCYCELHDTLLDVVYQSCPNLRELDFRVVKVAPDTLGQHIRTVTQSCPQLRSFKFQEPSANRVPFAATLLDGPLLQLSSLKLSLGYQGSTMPQNVGAEWVTAHAVNVLDICDLSNYILLFKIMSTMTGLSRLTLGGYMCGQQGSGYSVVETYYDNDKSIDLRLPDFACQDTLQFLDVTQLEFFSLKCHELFFARVQKMPQLKRLEISHRQLQDARLEESWTDPDEDRDFLGKETLYPEKVLDPRSIRSRRRQSYCNYSVAYVKTNDSAYGPEGEQYVHYHPFEHHPFGQNEGEEDTEDDEFTGVQREIEMAVDAITEKIFLLFPAVEFLYVFDNQPLREYWKYEHYISEHMASALVMMMPKLKVMAFDRALGEGLRRVKKTYPEVTFDCIRT
ncbi:hypothetical protein EDD21DRAFT_417263 [Dissophora ornata]|nr:hypothetical protein BGZ58_005791 [Dissophora ornata]KAI8598947.1 hypothetical protein EDD21DRAFT_417263 [Dissophora ornata]